MSEPGFCSQLTWVQALGVPRGGMGGVRGKRYNVGGGVSSAGRLLEALDMRNPEVSVGEKRAARWGVTVSSQPLIIFSASGEQGLHLNFPTDGRRELKKEGAHPDGGESRGARAWCGDTGPGRRGGATSYFSAG